MPLRLCKCHLVSDCLHFLTSSTCYTRVTVSHKQNLPNHMNQSLQNSALHRSRHFKSRKQSPNYEQRTINGVLPKAIAHLHPIITPHLCFADSRFLQTRELSFSRSRNRPNPVPHLNFENDPSSKSRYVTQSQMIGKRRRADASFAEKRMGQNVHRAMQM